MDYSAKDLTEMDDTEITVIVYREGESPEMLLAGTTVEEAPVESVTEEEGLTVEALVEEDLEIEAEAIEAETEAEVESISSEEEVETEAEAETETAE